jgi:hypothetical protein
MPVGEEGSVVNDRDARRDALDVGADVCRKDDDAVAGHLAQEGSQPNPLLRIQARRRLVDDQESRIVEQRLRDSDALTHSAGKTA